MNDPVPGYLTPAFVVLGFSAVVLAGFGGMFSGQKIQALFGAGVGFCLLMLVVLSIMLFDRVSLWTQSHITTGFGVLAGVCYHLLVVADGAWTGLLGHAAVGGVLSFLVYWARDTMRPST
ncbi:hypothetical protein [Brevundimonas sp.]|uniref:hypothetical protein n=1 Tax=Brevundimonas sp. TaxID=1871086 RepID=UPI0025B9A120|nr:hypothetical protein [Brevundimonas sp.]